MRKVLLFLFIAILLSQAAVAPKAAAANEPVIITLDADTAYTKGLDVSGRSHIIYLNGFTLNISNSGGDGITVTNGHTLNVIGPGTLNVSASGALNAGIMVSGTNSTLNAAGAAIINALASANAAVYAGFGGSAVITGTANGKGGGVRADYGGRADIHGDAQSSDSIGALATYAGIVNVTGNASGFIAAAAENGGTVNISGNAAGRFCGAQAYADGVVRVAGNATATETGEYPAGAMAVDGGKVYVTGEISGAGDYDIKAGGMGFNIGQPVKTETVSGRYFWDEYSHLGAYVFKRQGEADISEITGFVRRLYENVLGRSPDGEGFDIWVMRLTNGEYTGAEIAFGFYFCNEFLTKDITNEDYIDNLYATMMDREGDERGRTLWLERLNGGTSRDDVLAGFIRSPEFAGRCREAGITVGEAKPRQEEAIRAFVWRLYNLVLGRGADATGLAAWSERLAHNSITGSQAAHSFFFDPVHGEYGKRNRTDEQYVDDLYTAVMGRSAHDDPGRQIQINRLKNEGWSRERLFEDFAISDEFAAICLGYGITP